MSSRVVCVSGPDGAHMQEIAHGLADRLGFQLVDEAIVSRAAAEAGVDPTVVADVEKRQSFIDRLLGAFATSSDASAFVFAGGGGFLATEGIPLTEELRELIRAAIEETADRGNVVIVAHAASHALGARDDVLRVLVTASAAVRSRRLGEEQGLSEDEATKAVEESDAGRADYLRRFYGAKDELPTDYDVVVNTDRLTVSQAVSVAALAAA
jgi:cytidylate kinase